MPAKEVPRKWDHEADVIIVGGGTAGLPAGITAAESGLKATILEVRPACGGSLNMAFGGVAFAGTDEQKAAGIDDSPEILYQDLVNISGADQELARAYADNQLDAYTIIKEEGIKWPGILALPGHSRDRSLGWLLGYGADIVKALENRARRSGVEILFRHRATRLITDPPTGRVIGLKVSVKDETRNFKAKKAVILTTGGFGRNREMLAEYAPEMVDCIPKMPAGHLGDGLRMGLAMGAATRDIGVAVAPSWPVCVETHSSALPAVDWGGIMVNVHGKRFHDESSSESFYGPMTGAGMKQPGGVYWVVFNDDIKKSIGKVHEKLLKTVENCKQYKASTIEELANIAGIDVRGLTETVDKYNGDIDSPGYDTVFGRRFQLGQERPLIKIDKPPFFTVKCKTSITSLKGGLRINGSAQVVNQYGEVIPGLYAAGEVTGGLSTKTYLLCVLTSAAMTQGIIAARNTAKAPV